jgi:hypothetical protein
MHEMHPDTIDPGPEVTEPVQPAFLRAPVEAVGPVPQQAPQVTFAARSGGYDRDGQD